MCGAGAAALLATLLCAVHSAHSTHSAHTVPVFLWGDLQYASQHSNPLERTSGAALGRTLLNELESEPLLVAFVEPSLSVEDLSMKNVLGASSFPYLHANLGDSLYLPKVQGAVETLDEIVEPARTERVTLTESGLSVVPRESTSYLLIELDDAREGESRAVLLRRHNDFMQDTIAELRAKYERLLCVYTARYPSWVLAANEQHSRIRRQAQPETVSTGLFYNITGDLLLYYDKIMIQERTNAAVDLGEISASSSKNDTEITVTLGTANYTILLYFNLREGYWFLDEVDVTSSVTNISEKISSSSVFAIEGFSYHCSNGVEFKGPNGTYTLTIQDFQLQPFFSPDGNNMFGDSFDCVGFFSVPIWSGLFVVFIMLSIFFYGVIMMMDIRTMDRFDDPKGKTITINAAE